MSQLALNSPHLGLGGQTPNYVEKYFREPQQHVVSMSKDEQGG